MKTQSRHQGFTRKELLVTLALVFILGTCSVFYILRLLGRESIAGKVVSTAGTAHVIHTLLVTWAEDHDGEFPTAHQFSNEAFRELFKAGLVDTEKPFSIAGDAWHKSSVSGDGKRPDNEIGSAPDFAKALQRGECAYAYVSGLNLASRGSLPLLANAFSESLGVYTKDHLHKGGVFHGTKGVYVTVGGSAKIGELSPDFRILEMKDGKATDVFSQEWGTNPEDIKNPEG
jgi:hypothetical protein